MPRPKTKKSKIKAVALLTLAAATAFLIGSLFDIQHSVSASDQTQVEIPHSELVRPHASPVATNAESNAPTPPHAPDVRFAVGFKETRELAIATIIDSFVVVAPEIATVQAKNRYTLTVTGENPGETMLIVSSGSGRQTFVIQVTRRPLVSKGRMLSADDIPENVDHAKTKGSLEITYIHGFDEHPSVVRTTVDTRTSLSGSRTVHISADTFKMVGKGDPNRAFATVQGFGFNRLSAGIETPTKSIEILDSQVNISQLSLNNFTIRGFHMMAASKPTGKSGFEKKGLEIFAGLSRPSINLYDNDRGKLAGFIVPIVAGDNWQIRGGAIAVAPEKNNRAGSGGVISEVIGSFALNKNITAEGEVGFSKGDLSGWVRVDAKFMRSGATAEITRLAQNSPLNSIGAQPGGRASESISAFWRPADRLAISSSYNHSSVRRAFNSQLSDFDRSSFLVGSTWRLNKSSSFKFRFLDQRFETTIPGATAKFQIATKSFELGHNSKLNRNWSNSFDIRLNYSLEADAGEQLETGFGLNEQIRFTAGKNTITGFANYNRKSPSLTDVIIRNPQLLSVQFRQAFLLDPVLFLQTNRERLGTLLYGIQLPQATNLDGGARFQSQLSRLTLSGEVRYRQGDLLSVKQKNVYASVTSDIHLDNADSIQINAWKAFGSNEQSAATFSYRHIFGADSGGGFKFGDLLGLNRGAVEGRVYYDLNGNGRDDGEPGADGVTIRLGHGHTTRTDSDGRYKLSATEGVQDVMLVSDALGIQLRATTAAQRQIRVQSGKVQMVSFGVTDSGFVSGRIFNDLTLASLASAGDQPGLTGIKVTIRSNESTGSGIKLEGITDGSGTFNFPGLRPGKYILEIQPETLPVDFRIPEQTAWDIVVASLGAVYFDIPIAAQRAVSGVVFIDKNGNGRFDPGRDEPVAGASIMSDRSVATSDNQGNYILRNLPAGDVKVFVRLANGVESQPLIVSLSSDPIIRRGVNFSVRR